MTLGLIDRLSGNKDKLRELDSSTITDEDIVQAWRQACWDLYISNLPEPRVVDVNDKKARKREEVPDKYEEAIPQGFSIDPKKGWRIYFSKSDLPRHIKDKKDLLQYARSVLHHECTHYTKVPADGLTEAVLIDSALKGFKDPQISQNKDVAAAYSHLVMNVMGDLIGDTFLAKEKYGREDFGDLTVQRERDLVRQSRETRQSPSLLWQTLVSTYEKLWKEDLGLNAYVPQRSQQTEKAADDLVAILGKDWKSRQSWEDKVRKFAAVLEPIIKQTAREAQQQKGNSKYGGKGGSSSLPLPDDVETQMCHTTESPLGNDGGNEGKEAGKKVGKEGDKAGEEGRAGETDIDDAVLQAIYERNKDAPGKFAGTMGALERLDPHDALRLMYRARAKELLMRIQEEEKQRAEKSPSYQTAWNVGDPLIGKGGLEIIPSMLASGKPIPGLTTYKRKMDPADQQGTLQGIPDLFIVIDSSGSMSWDPWRNPPEARGDFDKAILAAEGSALYAIEKGGKVAVINHSGDGNVTQQDYTRDIDKLERAIMVCYKGGTVVPINAVHRMIKRTQNPLLTCYMSDCQLANPEEACEQAFAHGITPYDCVAVFAIGGGNQGFTNKMKEKGALIYDVTRIDDLIGLIVGQVRQQYQEAEGGKQHAH